MMWSANDIIGEGVEHDGLLTRNTSTMLRAEVPSSSSSPSCFAPVVRIEAVRVDDGGEQGEFGAMETSARWQQLSLLREGP